MSIIKSIRSQLAPINHEGFPFVGGFALASLVLFWLWTPLGWIGTVLTLWCAYFFRDPTRVAPVAPLGAPLLLPRPAAGAAGAGGHGGAPRRWPREPNHQRGAAGRARP